MMKFNPGTDDLCSRCPHNLGQQSFNDCFLDNPPYSLALDVEEVKDVRTDMDVSTLSARVVFDLANRNHR